jgi:KilA-N domain
VAGKIQKVVREVNGITVEQRSVDGFINGTAMCVAHDKKINAWFRNQDTLDLFVALALDLDPNFNCENSRNLDISRLSASNYTKIFVGLVISKSGSPETGGGTWLHPDLAVQLAQWCSKPFALQVSRWVREWMTSAYNPIQLEADADRVQMRDNLKDKKRLEFTGQVKAFLEAAGEYKPGTPNTIMEFKKAHGKLNRLLTTETAEEMRERLEKELGRPVKEKELLRDYFPITDLANYASLCQAAANEMAANGTSPLKAIDIAAKQILSPSYVAKPIDFTERISLVRRRLEQKDQIPLLPED